jgi:3-oxoacyl-[acyl-carrier protein] reductase
MRSSFAPGRRVSHTEQFRKQWPRRNLASGHHPRPATPWQVNALLLDVLLGTRSLAKELGPRQIRVNAINPGMVETEGLKTVGLEGSDSRKQVEAQTPLGRIGKPDAVAPAAVFLASSDSACITGETLHITGGMR